MLTLLAALFLQADLLIENGRVIDPESGLDAVRHVAIKDGRIISVTVDPVPASAKIDAKGLVVAPGFIDLHSHGQDDRAYALKAQDGVTAAFELEVGTAEVDAWYRRREGKSRIHHGVAVGHIHVRMAVMGDAPKFLPDAAGKANTKPASEEQIAEIVAGLRRGLDEGAVAVGFGIMYTGAMSRDELHAAFRVAAERKASCHVHLRYNGVHEPHSSTRALEEVIAAAAVTGAPLHVVHIHSTSLRSTAKNLAMLAGARANGIDATTEVYPYEAGMTDIRSAVFGGDWRKELDIDYGDLMWPPTGERLTKDTYEKYREQGGLVALFSIPAEAVRAAVAHPLAIIGSDGILDESGRGHPRSAGTCSRILGKYVREDHVLTLTEAVRKMSLMPAQRLEKRVESMRQKGRVRAGADADLAVFDAERVIDRATYANPLKPSDGMVHVLVGGVPVVKDGKPVDGTMPGRGIRTK